MRGKIAAIAMLLLLFLGTVAPLAFSESDAIDEGDFYIDISTSDDSHHVDDSIGNGRTKTWNIYVINLSDKYLGVSYSAKSSSDELKIVSMPEPIMLAPNGEKDNRTTGEISMSVDRYAKDDAKFTVSVIVKVIVLNSLEVDMKETELTWNISVDSSFQTSDMYNKFLGFIDNNLPAPFDNPIFTMLVSIIAWFLIFSLIVRLLVPILAAILDRTTPDVDDRKQFEKILFRLCLPLILLMAINQGLIIVGASNEVIAGFGSLSSILYVVIIAMFVWKVYEFIITSVLKRFEDIDDDNNPVDSSLLPLCRLVGKLIIIVASVSAILGSFGIDLQGILISAGVVSLGITMGAQNVLSQFFSGMVILITRPFKAGDFLKINDNVYIVKKVKIMFTQFYSWEKDRIITMPNNVVTASTIHNMTENGLPVKQYVYFSVAYGTDLEKAKNIMIETAKKNPYVVEDEKYEGPGFRVTNFLGSGIELRLSYFARTFDDTSSSAGLMRQAIYKAFVDNGIEIPYDRLEVDILNDVTGEKRPDDHTSD